MQTVCLDSLSHKMRFMFFLSQLLTARPLFYIMFLVFQLHKVLYRCNICYICSIYICSYPGKETTTYLLLSWQRVESYFFFSFIFISWRLITLQYCSGFCHTSTWISHGYTCIPHPNPPSHLPLHPIPLGLPSAPGPSTCLMHPTWAEWKWSSSAVSCSLRLHGL